jgi:hypothetical protein
VLKAGHRPGADLYRQTQASRLKCGLVVGPVTDTFTVTASNEIYTSGPGVINVPIIDIGA